MTTFRKSSYSGLTCVEVGFADDGMVHVRDTKDRTKPAHVYTPDEWDAFVKGVRNGEFDLVRGELV